jgi:hypothetical protein
MPHLAAGLRGRLPPALLLLVLGAPACWGLRTDGLADGGQPVTSVDARPRDGSVAGVPLPGAGVKSVAIWTCSGGASASVAGAQLGVRLGALSGAGAVSAPSGARMTLDHFADTVADKETIR